MIRVGRPMSLAPATTTAKTEAQAMEEWGYEASLLIKRQMQARNWGYAELSLALRAQGVKRSPAVINRRINRGNFSAGFLLVCLKVLEDGAGVNSGTVTAPGDSNTSNGIQR